MEKKASWKKVSLIIIVGIIASIILIALVGNLHKDKQKDVLNQILNGKATISNEARALDSYTKEEIEQSPELQRIFDEVNEINILLNSHNNIHTTYGDLYTLTVITSYGDTVIYRSLPRVVLTVSDVGTAGSTDIKSKLEIIEYVSVNGDMDTVWKNAIRYRNISSELVCGDNTSFTSSIKLSGETASDNRNILEAILGSDEFSNTIHSSDSEYNSNTDVIYENVYRADMDKEELYDGEHYLNIASSISTVDSSKSENLHTTAVSEWTFNVYYAGSLNTEYDDVKILCDTNYLVNMK